ncbi:hypothetical protein [Tatumella punctata]|uniref:Uncharacterized protein n=1 Tax=Tatumella punctata TaxID=399969 RepID=A0ABW1VP50_9GAMM
MSWKITCNNDHANYSVDGSEDHFSTYTINFIDENYHTEDSSDYKGPNDVVLIANFTASSDHGDFTWEVTSRRAGFNGFAEIENIYSQTPDGCTLDDEPDFDIEEI